MLTVIIFEPSGSYDPTSVRVTGAENLDAAKALVEETIVSDFWEEEEREDYSWTQDGNVHVFWPKENDTNYYRSWAKVYTDFTPGEFDKILA